MLQLRNRFLYIIKDPFTLFLFSFSIFCNLYKNLETDDIDTFKYLLLNCEFNLKERGKKNILILDQEEIQYIEYFSYRIALNASKFSYFKVNNN